jgi:hypothetical protein
MLSKLLIVLNVVQTKNTGQLSFLTNFMATGGCVGASLLIPLPAQFPVFSRFRVLIRIHLYMQLS